MELLGEVAEFAVVLVVLAAHGEREPPAGGNDDAGWDELDVALVDVAGRERLDAVVGVVGPVGRGALRVEAAVRGAQPTVSDGGVGVCRAHEGDFVAVRIK